VNEFNNAGLFRDMSPEAGAAARLVSSTALHRDGPMSRRDFLDLTRRMSTESRLEPAALAPSLHEPSSAAATPYVAVQGTFGGHLIPWDIPSANNPGASLTVIPYKTETGPLGNASNSAAIAQVASSFAMWTAPTTTTARVTTAPASLGVDVDAVCPSPTCYKNFSPAFGASFGSGDNPIIFDSDGSIFNDLFGNPCAAGGIGGSVSLFTTTGHYPIEGYEVLDGAWLGGVCGTLTLAQYAQTITHESGHYLGLDHTVVNSELLMANRPFLWFGVPPCSTIEVMGPVGIVGCQSPNKLQTDDISTVSELYPTASFARTRGLIMGHLFAPDGSTPVNCANMIIRSTSNPFVDAEGAVSGFTRDFTLPTPTNPNLTATPGFFLAPGLKKNGNYTVTANQIPDFAAFGSGLTNLCEQGPPPFTLPGPNEFYNGGQESHTDNPNCFVPVVATASGATADLVLNDASTSGPCAGLSAGTLVFKPQAVHTSSGALMLTLTNSGDASLNISKITITGANSGDFSETNTCVPTVAVGGHCRMSVVFTPSGTGKRSAKINITDNAPGSPQAVKVSGTGH
jgi:hypothetical protein